MGYARQRMMDRQRVVVEVRGAEIEVTLPGTIYSVTYYKSSMGSYLTAKSLPISDDPNGVMTSGEFLAQAWKRANAKARELGWIA
jgi:hypothetical protein